MTSTTPTPPAPESDDIRALHAALVTKRSNADQLLWQAPVISLTAQAFLLTIAFDTDKTAFYRQTSGLVATAIGLISWQLFLRHAALEKEASMKLEDFENKYFKMTVHSRPTGDGPFVARWRSRPIWAWTLFLISITGLFPMAERFFK
jgi:hypothetical protein